MASVAYLSGLTVQCFDMRMGCNQYNIYVTVSGLFVMTTIYSIIYNINYYITDIYGMKLKIAFCTVIYRKAIRLSPSSLEKANIGQMVNLLANDVSKFQNTKNYTLVKIIFPMHNTMRD
ncbi:multidrug resistance-associated protein 4-like [Centruroides sculpturatus]|uniref:multidrug resistance-associated protein 4-like n=1 Tax=Centruroides sculpturatus TaxID=218467 RepID=UPI000C6D2B82|nr:multidrug resistance-associated protein 4-like [Centruroides sculpturatus]